MNMSEILIMFTTGAGVFITEARGILNVMVSLPPHYDATWDYEVDTITILFGYDFILTNMCCGF